MRVGFIVAGALALSAGVAFVIGRMIPPAGKVVATLTKMSRDQALATLRAAFVRVLGREPSERELLMLAAHSDLETRGWQAMWSYNFGNIVATRGSAWMLLPGNPHHFHAYQSAAEGAEAMVSLIKRRYPQALALLGSNDPIAYGRALMAGGYSEGEPDEYARAVATRYHAA